MTGTTTPITHRATLRCTTTAQDCEGRMRREIDRLRRDGSMARAAQNRTETEGDIWNVAFCRSGGTSIPVFEIAVTGICPEATLAELARLTLALVTQFPISHIAWLRDAALLDRDTFLTALAPPPARPKRPRRATTCISPRPASEDARQPRRA